MVLGKLSFGWGTGVGWEWWWFTPIWSLKPVRLFPCVAKTAAGMFAGRAAGAGSILAQGGEQF